MKRFLRDHGLTLTVFGLFLLFMAGQAVTGFLGNNQELPGHGSPALGFFAYPGSWHFLEATMENWESEFLQMGVYVLFTAFLFRRGSSESKPADAPHEETGWRRHPGPRTQQAAFNPNIAWRAGSPRRRLAAASA